MWSLVRSIRVTSLVASTATAELQFSASVQQQGRDVSLAASSLDFVPIPPLRHRKQASKSYADHSKDERGIVSYSSNWCGASRHTTASDAITNVFAYFTVPDLTLRPGTPAPQFASAWVGIDGAECNSTLLQAGVTTIVRIDGPVRGNCD
jgi:hypothetical protein